MKLKLEQEIEDALLLRKTELEAGQEKLKKKKGRRIIKYSNIYERRTFIKKEKEIEDNHDENDNLKKKTCRGIRIGKRNGKIRGS